jgi:hypothetical protein
MSNTTDLRDGYNRARQEYVGRRRPYELEISFADPVAIANSLLGEDGYPIGQMQRYYDEYSISGRFQSSCGQVTTYLRDSVLIGNWITLIDNQRGTVGETTQDECSNWIVTNVLNKTGYFGVLLGCHSFTLAIFNGHIRIYQAYMAMGYGGYNFTQCIEWDEEFSLIDFRRYLNNVILRDDGPSASTLFHGTCYPNANCNTPGHVNLCVYQLQAPFPNVGAICNNFKTLKRNNSQKWTDAMQMTVEKCAMMQSKIGRTRWTPDSHGQCEICNQAVSWLNRHHCRVCGKLICNTCKRTMDVFSSKRQVQQKVSSTVCINCFNTYSRH